MRRANALFLPFFPLSLPSIHPTLSSFHLPHSLFLPFTPLSLPSIYPRVPFQQALPMISNRSVYLQKGFAFVPLQKLVSIIVIRVRAAL